MRTLSQCAVNGGGDDGSSRVDEGILELRWRNEEFNFSDNRSNVLFGKV